MWIARNKDGELKVFEKHPRRFHEGPALDTKLVGFNDEISVGNDEYSFWAVQEYCDSNRIDDTKSLGISIKTEKIINNKNVLCNYEPDWAKNITWNTEPFEIEISLTHNYMWEPSEEQIKACKEVYADILSAKGFDIGTVNSELNRLEEELKKLREE